MTETHSSKLTSSDKVSALPTLSVDRDSTPRAPQRWAVQRNHRHSLDAAVSLPAYAIEDLEAFRYESSWGPSESQRRREGGGMKSTFRAPGSCDSSPGPSRETPKQRVSFDSDRELHGTPRRVGQGVYADCLI